MCARRAPRHKVSRRFGIDVYGTGGEALQRRLSVPPGGVRGRRRETEYGRQLREKQKVKAIYGVREEQFRRYVKTAQRSGEPMGQAVIELLERRLDNVVYRLGFARTRLMARQLINHGHIRIDGRRVKLGSYLVSPGERVSLESDARSIPGVEDEMKTRGPTVSWLQREDAVGVVKDRPVRGEIEHDIDESLIVAFYTR
ncbi:MAG TPA: 30S ribosomal protein S4 [Candidatus Manganitrophaceae bacterium]|nr:30S ribosomal protein S4 [Candidatus Manganitrophaceae bacterium]